MRVAAYQAPLLEPGSMDAVGQVRRTIDRCEAHGVDLLCCPEALLGGLADNLSSPHGIALDVGRGELDAALAPLASTRVTSIVGFTESEGGSLFNSAAVYHHGAVAGLYRKRHPAIRRSVYRAGDRTPVFTIGSLTFGIVICYDSTFPELVESLAAQGARLVFVPSNNALPRAAADVVVEARRCDVTLARDNAVWIVRADVAGEVGPLVAYGASCIVDPCGTVRHVARRLAEDVLIADI